MVRINDQMSYNSEIADFLPRKQTLHLQSIPFVIEITRISLLGLSLQITSGKREMTPCHTFRACYLMDFGLVNQEKVIEP